MFQPGPGPSPGPGPGPAPGPKPGPSPGHTHYGDPKKGGCLSDEEAVNVQGVGGDFCAPECSGTSCPGDKPKGVTATPQCVLQEASAKRCALICDPSANGGCGPSGNGLSCKSVQGTGICTYND